MSERSGHLGTNVNFVIAEPPCLGCKGSWVQIPPRRPFKLNTYHQTGFTHQSRIMLMAPQANWRGLGTNSGQKKIPVIRFALRGPRALDTLIVGIFCTQVKPRKRGRGGRLILIREGNSHGQNPLHQTRVFRRRDARQLIDLGSYALHRALVSP